MTRPGYQKIPLPTWLLLKADGGSHWHRLLSWQVDVKAYGFKVKNYSFHFLLDQGFLPSQGWLSDAVGRGQGVTPTNQLDKQIQWSTDLVDTDLVETLI